MAANQSLDELFRLYLERTLTANAIGAPGSQDVTVTNVVTSPVPVDITDVDMNLLAKEATLAAVRDLTTTLRDTIYRRTDSLPAGNNTIGRVFTVLEVRTLLNLPSAARITGGMEGPYSVGNLSRVAFDVNVTEVAGIGQALMLYIERQGVDGIWYPIYTSPSVTAVGKVSTSVGEGMTVGQSLGSTLRVRYEITGTNASFTFSASLVGK